MKPPTLPSLPARSATTAIVKHIEIARGESVQSMLEGLAEAGVTNLDKVYLGIARGWETCDDEVQVSYEIGSTTILDDSAWEAAQLAYDIAFAEYKTNLTTYNRWLADEERRQDLATLNALLAKYPDHVFAR